MRAVLLCRRSSTGYDHFCIDLLQLLLKNYNEYRTPEKALMLLIFPSQLINIPAFFDYAPRIQRSCRMLRCLTVLFDAYMHMEKKKLSLKGGRDLSTRKSGTMFLQSWRQLKHLHTGARIRPLE